MPQSKILVDTNAYLRLAKTIRPLLFVTFSNNEYCLYILPELNNELGNHKLQSKFPWVSEEEFESNRKHYPTISRRQQKAIATTFEYVWDYVQTECPGPSKVDARYIAVAIELDIPVVTDDQDMTALGTAFGAKVMSTLELLKIMADCGHVDIVTIQGLCDYWRYTADIPANFDTDLQRLFGI
ncbi:beta/alpha barrel domain-containing protein [Acinetobacter indicus]|uniref:DNA-binding protein n=1 Tax=Acinetobacter indicus TaxID=756892 RepID=UPI0012E26353|nr:DNA-binding protein [Acinetobacter indicus]